LVFNVSAKRASSVVDFGFRELVAVMMYCGFEMREEHQGIVVKYAKSGSAILNPGMEE
jgi:hypothetical protein